MAQSSDPGTSGDTPRRDQADDCLARFLKIKQKIAQVALQAGRLVEDVHLVVASKTQPSAALDVLLMAGHRAFGENRVRESADKWPALRWNYPDLQLRLIGPLQSNKAREAVEIFDVIETLDRRSLLEALTKEVERQGRQPEFYVQVNTGNEPQKGGVGPKDADSFIATCSGVYGLKVSGLMCIPPQGEQASPHFALLAQIAARNGLAALSMGMSSDYPLAIQLGATHVRIGSGIFGARA